MIARVTNLQESKIDLQLFIDPCNQESKLKFKQIWAVEVNQKCDMLRYKAQLRESSPAAASTFENGSYRDGKWLCACNRPAVWGVVSKEGPTKNERCKDPFPPRAVRTEFLTRSPQT